MSFRERRVAAGLSVATVAKSVGVTRAAVYMWEYGKTVPRIDTLRKLAQLYGCSLDELVNG